jgi:nucleoside-diphosphate-sugar epimerase
MLEHLNPFARAPQRVVVIGAGGFVGGAVADRLSALGVPVLALGRAEVDLLAPDAGETLAGLLRAEDAVVAAAAIAPVKNTRMLVDNMRLVATLVTALTKCRSRIWSTSARTRSTPTALPLTESSPAAPRACGAMHAARRSRCAPRSQPAGHLRPTLIYGARDPHNGYGPNRFRRLAAESKEIILFGEGEERRDHVHIDDVAEIVTRTLFNRSVGSLNIATGEVHSFRDIAEQVVAISGRNVAIKSSPRTGPMPHDGYRPFDIASRRAFPDFGYLPLNEGLPLGLLGVRPALVVAAFDGARGRAAAADCTASGAMRSAAHAGARSASGACCARSTAQRAWVHRSSSRAWWSPADAQGSKPRKVTFLMSARFLALG